MKLQTRPGKILLHKVRSLLLSCIHNGIDLLISEFRATKTNETNLLAHLQLLIWSYQACGSNFTTCVLKVKEDLPRREWLKTSRAMKKKDDEWNCDSSLASCSHLFTPVAQGQSKCTAYVSTSNDFFSQTWPIKLYSHSQTFPTKIRT